MQSTIPPDVPLKTGRPDQKNIQKERIVTLETDPFTEGFSIW
jgi:hypothetical protein